VLLLEGGFVVGEIKIKEGLNLLKPYHEIQTRALERDPRDAHQTILHASQVTRSGTGRPQVFLHG
jgi:hypothetical protein